MTSMISACAARILGNEHSVLYVGRSAVPSDDEFFAERVSIPPGQPVSVISLSGGLRARLILPTLHPIAHGYVEVMRDGEIEPIAFLDLTVLSPAHDAEVWKAMYDLQHEDEVFYLFLLMMPCMAAYFREVGAAALIRAMRFRPSCGLTGHEQAGVFQAFVDGLRAERGVGICVMRQDNHSAPLLFMHIGALLRFGGTFYTPLDKAELGPVNTNCEDHRLPGRS
ncbi:hypothetical protein IM725_05945 [Ramlibacter aquaticus]|uniref:Uncharacterized protein n=1 Tax=Ramlibacter aquaticus TaxID=2780094 RepID=A0ABR9SCN6_9BURK|nr:hypothetical protein [Ramlibacter aquaticus]MBE7940110.1 hypothetical protein [Ramlibacter aquaticus]